MSEKIVATDAMIARFRAKQQKLYGTSTTNDNAREMLEAALNPPPERTDAELDAAIRVSPPGGIIEVTDKELRRLLRQPRALTPNTYTAEVEQRLTNTTECTHRWLLDRTPYTTGDEMVRDYSCDKCGKHKQLRAPDVFKGLAEQVSRTHAAKDNGTQHWRKEDRDVCEPNHRHKRKDDAANTVMYECVHDWRLDTEHGYVCRKCGVNR